MNRKTFDLFVKIKKLSLKEDKFIALDAILECLLFLSGEGEEMHHFWSLFTNRFRERIVDFEEFYKRYPLIVKNKKE